MKIVGIIGGLSPESTMKYYKWLNEGVRQRLGGHHSAKILLSSVDFGLFVELKEKGEWDTQGKLLAHEAKALERAGADFIVLATNTMHKLAHYIEAAIQIPFLHLAEATAERILETEVRKIGLLGTRYTMEMDFYKDKLRAKGILPFIPDEVQRTLVNDIIYNQLCLGKILPESRAIYRDVMTTLVTQGAQGIIMGCTEITMLIDQSDAAVPLYDTTRIHVEKTLATMFGEK